MAVRSHSSLLYSWYTQFSILLSCSSTFLAFFPVPNHSHSHTLPLFFPTPSFPSGAFPKFFFLIRLQEHERIISLNAKGLNVPENDMHIILIQETHFGDDKLSILRNKFFPTTYHSTYKAAKARGVSILLSAQIPWTHTDIKMDPEGCFLFLKGMIVSFKVTLANLYAPNSHHDLFLERHLEKLLEFADGQLIIGGGTSTSL